MSDAVSFEASIAPLQSAITIASDGGARVKVDIPEGEMPAIVRLMLLRGKRLKITVEEYYGTPASERRNQGGGAGGSGER